MNRLFKLSTILALTSIPHTAFALPKADPQMQAVLDQLTALKGKPVETLSAEDARKQPTPSDAVEKLLKMQGKSTSPEKVYNVDDTTLKTLVGTVPVRVYTPKGDGPFPGIVYVHGGGWVIATNDVYDASPRALSNLTKSVVISIEYPKAPEHKFPAAHTAAYAATQYVFENAKSLKIDPSKIAIVGESAGGNMATAVCMMARDKNGHMPIYQGLIYPVTNDDMNTPSYQENALAMPLNKAMMSWFMEKTISGPQDLSNHYLTVLKGDVSKLPPATVITAEIDPLMSEGKSYADKLKEAGVPVHYQNYEGVTHEFFGMAAVVDKAKAAQQLLAGDLNNAFKK